MRPETTLCLTQIHALETMVYRYEQAGMSATIDGLAEHLKTMIEQLTEVTERSVMIAPVMLRGGPEAPITISFNIQPANVENAQNFMEAFLPLLEEGYRKGHLRKSD